MNKELWKTDVNKKVSKIVIKDEDGILIQVEDGEDLEITAVHSSDCCEHVYGDFSSLSCHVSKIEGNELNTVAIKSVDGMGFLIVFELSWNQFVKVFVPCYNYQNGYYSSNLELSVRKGSVTTAIDITELVEDHID